MFNMEYHDFIVLQHSILFNVDIYEFFNLSHICSAIFGQKHIVCVYMQFSLLWTMHKVV